MTDVVASIRSTSRSTSTWNDLISGRRHGWGASLARGMLACLVPGYCVAIGSRNWMYDHGWLRQQHIPMYVISIGNLTVGGTGKTPTVAWVVRTMQSLGLRPAMISRGYGGDGQVNDEMLLLDQLLPGVPHLLSPQRILGARQLLSRPADARPQVLVLDDAFQHRQLARDFDLVLIDSLNPWGYGQLLPRGLLREPIQSLSRADCVLLTRCDQVEEETLNQIERKIQQWTDRPIIRSRFSPAGLINAKGDTRPIETLLHSNVAAFSGIGNPSGFRRSLTNTGLTVPDARYCIFPDHYRYRPSDLDSLGNWGVACEAESLITTQKDLVKIPQTELGGVPLWALQIELAFADPASEERLQNILKSGLGIPLGSSGEFSA